MIMIFSELKKQLNDHYDGKPWYGPNLKDSLESLNNAQITKKVGRHSIKELVAHMINWRQFAIEKLTQNKEFDIKINSDQDWVPEELLREISWANLLEILQITQQNLIKAIDKIDNEFLHQIIPGREYDFQHLLFGIIQHDIYHLGQINLIKRYLSN